MGNLVDAEKAMLTGQDIEAIFKKGVQIHLTTPAEKAAFKTDGAACGADLHPPAGRRWPGELSLLADEKRARGGHLREMTSARRAAERVSTLLTPLVHATEALSAVLIVVILVCNAAQYLPGYVLVRPLGFAAETMRFFLV